MIRRVPLIPTLLVALACATMVALGFWQLDRLHQKEALLVRYAAADRQTAEVPFPQDEASLAASLYRRSRLDCAAVRSISPTAGHNARGETGWAQRAECSLAGGTTALVDIGWSRQPVAARWSGGIVTGVIAPGMRLVADPPQAGLEPLARPDPKDIPNNHLSYAVQWFLFALTALVIYGLALRKRWRASGG